MKTTPFLRRIFEDSALRTVFLLYSGAALNASYAAFHLVSGIRYSSSGAGALAVYYLLFAINRLFLIRAYQRERGLKEGRYEYVWRVSLRAGVFLLLLGLSVALGVLLIAFQTKSAPRSVTDLFISAAYTLTLLFLAVRGSIRHRRGGDPVLSAAKSVSVAAALVSVFSLEEAVFASSAPSLRRVLSVSVGTGAVLSVLSLAFYSIFYARGMLKHAKK